jgi:menaquinol-cytochrome c reductase iron-sulfur subunit
MAEDDDTRWSESERTPRDAGSDPPDPSRRRWLGRALIGTGVVAGGAVLAPIVTNLVAPAFEHPAPRWAPVGPAKNFQVGHTVRVVFENISPVPWSGQVGLAAAWLRRASDTRFTAFSVNCTHLGCPVRWLRGAELFMCPCHGGVYYQDGKVASGPPPRPLPRYPVRVRGGQVQIRTSPLPVTTTT